MKKSSTTIKQLLDILIVQITSEEICDACIEEVTEKVAECLLDYTGAEKGSAICDIDAVLYDETDTEDGELFFAVFWCYPADCLAHCDIAGEDEDSLYPTTITNFRYWPKTKKLEIEVCRFRFFELNEEHDTREEISTLFRTVISLDEE